MSIFNRNLVDNQVFNYGDEMKVLDDRYINEDENNSYLKTDGSNNMLANLNMNNNNINNCNNVNSSADIFLRSGLGNFLYLGNGVSDFMSISATNIQMYKDLLLNSFSLKSIGNIESSSFILYKSPINQYHEFKINDISKLKIDSTTVTCYNPLDLQTNKISNLAN
jgi:hypothetical protein